MSHYAVAVISEEYPTEDVLNDILEPFDEGKPEEEYYVYMTKSEIIADAKEYAKKLKKAQEENRLIVPSQIELAEKLFNAKTDEDFYKLNTYSDSVYDKDGNLLSKYNRNSKWDWWTIGGRWSGEFDGKDIMTVKELKDYVSEDVDNRRTYAILTSDGNWEEPGKMGWWGLSFANEEDEDNFTKKYIDLLNQEPEDYYVAIVDCHI